MRIRFDVSFGSAAAGKLAMAVQESAIAKRSQGITGPWTLTIGDEQMRLDRLKPWTDITPYRYYSGAATYNTDFGIENVPGRAWLDLGDVREIAGVSINGAEAGTSWMHPRRLEISGLVHAGKNHLSVRVTNLLINRILGQPAPDYQGLTDIRFPLPREKEMIHEPLPSGLFGPVRLLLPVVAPTSP